MASFRKLGEAGPGDTLALSRELKLLTVFNEEGQATEVIDAFSSVKKTCQRLRDGQTLPVDENMEVVFQLPVEHDWRYVFFLLDFDSQEPCPVPGQAIAEVESGSFFFMPLSKEQAESFGIAALSHPRMTVSLCIRDADTKSFVVAVGPGPSDAP